MPAQFVVTGGVAAAIAEAQEMAAEGNGCAG